MNTVCLKIVVCNNSFKLPVLFRSISEDLFGQKRRKIVGMFICIIENCMDFSIFLTDKNLSLVIFRMLETKKEQEKSHRIKIELCYICKNYNLLFHIFIL